MRERMTLKDLLSTALIPCGHTLYVWGGGWNAEDTGAGEDALRIGESPRWRAFYEANARGYDYKEHRYSFGDGLDCSGYVGWVLYNTLEESGGTDASRQAPCAQPTRTAHPEGYVCKSTDMAQWLSGLGFGTYVPKSLSGCSLPGDIVSMKGHVYISLGTCADGSVVLLHSSPQAGVQISGTVRPGEPDEYANAFGPAEVISEDNGTCVSCAEKRSVAWHLAEDVMSRQYPACHALFGTKYCGSIYLDRTLLHWDLISGPLSDPDGLVLKKPEEVLKLLMKR